MKDFLLLAFLFFTGSMISQIDTATITSKALFSDQEIKIKLPKDYDSNSNNGYPLVIVLNGEYLLNPVIGQTEYQSNFKIMPSAIVVGIHLESEKFFDNYSNEEAELILESENRFIEFFKIDLLPFLEKTYKTNEYKIVIADNKSTDLLNSFLLQDKPIFKAYISLDPKFSGRTTAKVIEKAKNVNQDIFYYVANSKDNQDFNSQNLEENLKLVNNGKFKLFIDNYAEDSHHSTVIKGIARGFEKVFFEYNSNIEQDGSVLGYENILEKD